MSADTVTAVCATIVATASLVVAVREASMTRAHNRHSVAPILEFARHHRQGGRTGLSLSNYGTGPALITQSGVWLDGAHLGAWEKDTAVIIRDTIRRRARISAMEGQKWTLPPGESRFLIYIDDDTDATDQEFYLLIRDRVALEFRYESLYRGENFLVSYDPKGTRTCMTSRDHGVESAPDRPPASAPTEPPMSA